MQVVIKKSVLFSTLKKVLNENRTGHSFYSDGSFLGRFEDEEVKKDFINSDVPLRANPTAQLQLHADNFDVTDPEFIPSSKSNFLSAAAAVLEHVPEAQIEKVYEKLHSLLDEAHEEEDKRNYGNLKETLNRLLIKESRDQYLSAALEKVNMGQDPEQVAIDLIEDYEEFQDEDYISLAQEIEDMQLSAMGYSMDSEQQVSEPVVSPEISQPPPVNEPRRSRRFIIRPGQKAELVQDDPVETVALNDELAANDSIEDLERIEMTSMPDEEAIEAVASQTLKGLGMLAMLIEPLELKRVSINRSDRFSPEQKAREINRIPHVKHGINNYKTFFLYNYDSSGRRHADLFSSEDELVKLAKHQIRVIMDHGASFLEPPTSEFIDVEDPEVSDFIPDDAASTVDDLPFDAKMAYSSAEDKDQFMAGFNAGGDYDPEYGPIPDMSAQHADYVDGFIYGYEDISGEQISLNESKTKIMTLDSQIQSDLYRGKLLQFKIFKSNIVNLQKKLGASVDQTIDSVAEKVASIMVNKVKNLEYGSQEEKIRQALRSTFANLVSYFDANKGVNQKNEEGVKDYQANNSQNFYRNVKEEYREEIIEDFLELLSKKYLKGDVYKLASGRKDPNDPNNRKREYYEIDPLQFKKEAEDYANREIDEGIRKQSASPTAEVDTDTGSSVSIDDPIASGDVELDMAYTLMADDQAENEKESIGGFYKKYASEFGFSGASGMRQWFIKKPDRLFKMMVMSMMGNGVLVDLHSKSLKTVLKIVADQLPDIVHTKIIDGKPVLDYDNHDPEEEMDNFARARVASGAPEMETFPPEYEEMFERYVMKESISEINQALDQLNSNRGILLTDIFVNSGGKNIRFTASPGGKLIIGINALIYDKFLVKFDKDYTDFVKDKLLNDKTVQREMQNVLNTEPTITPKVAQSLAEYFTGKKEKPVLEVVKEVDEEGDTFERFVFKKNEDGKYPNKGGAAKLLAQGIDGETFNFLFNKVSDHLKNTALQSFKPTIEFEKQKKSDILKNYKVSIVDPMLEKFEEKGVREQIKNAVRELVSFARG